MKHLEKLIRDNPDREEDIYTLSLLLKMIRNPGHAVRVLQDSDVREFFLELLSEPLVEQGFIDEEELENLPAFSLHGGEISRGTIRRISEAASAFLEQIEKSRRLKHLNSPFEKNMQLFCRVLGLSTLEKRILTLLVSLKQNEVLEDATRQLKFHSLDQIGGFWAEMLGVPKMAVLRAMGSKSTLRQAGILKLGDSMGLRMGFLDMLDTIDVLRSALFNDELTEETLLAEFVVPIKASTLEEEDYLHVRAHLDNIRTLLQDKSRPHSVLIYGEPGTGKTELASLLADLCGMDAFLVPATDDDGEEIAAGKRIDVFNLAQTLLSLKQEAKLLVFDEVEDVFNTRSDVRKTSKAWFNNLLETFRVNTIWLSNDGDIDPAYLRRFSYVMELGHPPKKHKRRILKKYHPQLSVRKAFLKELVSQPMLPIATIRQACEVVERNGLEGKAAERFIAHAVSGKFEANYWHKLRFKTLEKGKRKNKKESSVSYPFRPDLVNMSEDPNRVVDGMKKAGEGRLMLYGAPGTGKTSFAHHLAKKLDRPLLQKDAATLQSSYLGETEKLIKQAFEEARKKNAVLLIDEADSFLSNRAEHVRSWETSAVNQLLQEMEKFRGILMMSSNFIDRLDTAAARRFDFKIKFDYLTPPQRLAFFRRWMEKHGAGADFDEAWVKTQLQSLNRLVPGYFQLLRRKALITGEVWTAERLIDGLRQEMIFASKDQSKPIGFVQ